MRLNPIENPSGIMTRMAYAYSRRLFGKVISPISVVGGRVPGILPAYRHVGRFMSKKVTLDPALVRLLQAFTAEYNQCHFCMDIGRSFAAHDRSLLEKMGRVAEFETDAIFSDAERAALAYVAAATRDRKVPDVVFETLQRFYSDNEIVEITLVNAIENFYNQINGPLSIESDGLCAVPTAHLSDRAPGEVAAG